ncbi:hypothetical protein FPSE_03250 [Fusarium pseudograminearum CS3096]|uniref:Fucose-specific lectin n=1 Tax=Fusarium pseudograminearum (strain CS3096) TaxID=1028729 RepID=K3VNV0_FUSPC|nr:hypothetical protein FPSE_03250 [Fusarium pseudograminearum CS3096]EKJ76584.1 hypothetical protein FPSE_03250 [Fusarium pseudograminearum CS3096]
MNLNQQPDLDLFQSKTTSGWWVPTPERTQRHLLSFTPTDDILIARQYDKDSEEWDAFEIKGLDNFVVHHNGHVAVAAMHDRNMIFLQTPEGPVSATRHNINSDEWSVDFTVPGNAAPETAIAAFATDVELVVGFFGTEHKIHIHRRSRSF